MDTHEAKARIQRAHDAFFRNQAPRTREHTRAKGGRGYIQIRARPGDEPGTGEDTTQTTLPLEGHPVYHEKREDKTMATTTTQVATTETQAVESKKDRTYTQLEYALYSPSFAKDLARFSGTEEHAASLIAEIFNQARRVPTLHQCTIDSIRLNVAKVAALRLNPALPNMVHFIPRNAKQKNDQGKEVWVQELTMQYGYAGLRELVMRSPEVVDCFTQAVCVNDDYEPPADAISPPKHRLPSRFNPRGRVEGYYATIKLTNGHWRTLSMSVAEVEAHAERYAKDQYGKIGPAWGDKGKRPDTEAGLTSFDKMALKTVLRMLCNGRDVPMTPEVKEALHIEEIEERPLTAAQLQGYDRQGNRPAITAETGKPQAELIEDLYGDATTPTHYRVTPEGVRRDEAGQSQMFDTTTGEVKDDEATA